MKLHNILTNFVVLLSSLTVFSEVSAQQSFQLSSKFFEADFSTRNWSGKHSFGNVFCLTFPNGSEVKNLSYAMYNNNSLYFSRASYNSENATALYVVASTLPAGRAAGVDIKNLETQNQKMVDTYPNNFKQSKSSGALGESLTLTIRNSLEGGKEKVFPFSRSAVSRPDGLLASLSVHRLFVRGNDLIELAGLRYYKTPITPEKETEAIEELAVLVEAAATPLQTCSSGIPPRLK